MKFCGPLPECKVDETCVGSDEPRIRLEDVLQEDQSSTCLTFETNGRTVDCKNQRKSCHTQRRLFLVENALEEKYCRTIASSAR